MATTPFVRRLLDGPPPSAGPEWLAGHAARIGELPHAARLRGGALVEHLEAAGIVGRGGAGFPVGRKWRAIAERGGGPAVVVANGAEGEPRSAKDRALMTYRPHLVLDGALLAAEAIGADEVVVYVGEEHTVARSSIGRALAERPGSGPPIRIVAGPAGYVSGEASAAVHWINERDPRPTSSPPRPSVHGVRGRPTLVQNVESLAYAALVARFGAGWYRAAGRGPARGTSLVTVSGAPLGGVREVELGATLGEVAAASGVAPGDARAVLIGGYFGTWTHVAGAWDLPLDPAVLRDTGLAFGCGMVAFLGAGECGVSVTAQVMGFMADASAGQCGPCVYGLRALADSTARLARGEAGREELVDVERWTSQLPGRGACRHPDGAAQFLTSALALFGDELAYHARSGRCGVTGARLDAA